MAILTEQVNVATTPKLKREIQRYAKELGCKPSDFVRLAAYMLVDKTRHAKGTAFYELMQAVHSLDLRDAMHDAHFAFRKEGETLERFRPET